MAVGGAVLQSIPARRSWPEVLGWCLCGVALLHLALLHTITSPLDRSATPVLLLQPLAALAAGVGLVGVAWHHPPGSLRSSWLLIASAILLTVVGMLIQAHARYYGRPTTNSVTDLCYLLAYGLGIIGAALYLPRQSAWLGTTARTVLDAVISACAVYVILRSTEAVYLRWSAEVGRMVAYTAIDIGMLFALIILLTRYHRTGGPLVWYACWSVICLIASDAMISYVKQFPAQAAWGSAVAPLYTLHRAFLLLGGGWALRQPPRPPTDAEQMMPLREWAVWYILPRWLTCLAALSCIVMQTVPPVPAALLTVLLMAREVGTVIDQRRVYQELYQARQAALDAAHQTENFLLRILHDQSPPVHGLWTVISNLVRGGQHDVWRRLEPHVEHLTHLLEQLQEYIAVRPSKDKRQLYAVQLLPITAAAVETVQGRAMAQGVQLRIVLATQHTLVQGEASAVRRILDNLLSNALQATPNGGTILLHIADAPHAPEHTELSVQDTGSGLTDEQQRSVFAPLVRFREGTGFGLGLAIVDELTRALHGERGVRSTLGHGSTFWVRLPRVDSVNQEDTKEPT